MPANVSLINVSTISRQETFIVQHKHKYRMSVNWVTHFPWPNSPNTHGIVWNCECVGNCFLEKIEQNKCVTYKCRFLFSPKHFPYFIFHPPRKRRKEKVGYLSSLRTIYNTLGFIPPKFPKIDDTLSTYFLWTKWNEIWSWKILCLFEHQIFENGVSQNVRVLFYLEEQHHFCVLQIKLFHSSRGCYYYYY